MRSHRCHLVFGLAALLGLAPLAGCKKAAPPPGRAALVKPGANLPTITCPPNDKLVHAVEADQKGRTVRTACVVFAPGYYWLAAAVSYDPKTGADVRMHLVSGGMADRISDVDPLPAAAITDLIKKSDEIDVQIRKGPDNRLVRMGVRGRQGKSTEEIGMVLQLVAHAPPKLLWIGPGDQLRAADGCTVERTIDFEMPFGNRLEKVTTMRAKGGHDCTAGPTSQEQVETRGVALKAGRTLTL
jgi:hypothetical protein